MTISQILMQGMQILRIHVWLFFSLTGVVYAPAFILPSLLRYLPRDGSLPIAWIVITATTILITDAFIGAAIAIAVQRLSQTGRASVGECLRSLIRITLPLGGTALLLGLILATVWAGSFVQLILRSRPAIVWIFVSWSSMFLGYYLNLRFSVLWQVAAFENAFGFAALRRTWRMLRGNLKRALGLYTAGFLLFALFGAPAVFLAISLPFLGPAIAFLVPVVALSCRAAITTAFYLDLRSRQESTSAARIPLPSATS